MGMQSSNFGVHRRMVSSWTKMDGTHWRMETFRRRIEAMMAMRPCSSLSFEPPWTMNDSISSIFEPVACTKINAIPSGNYRHPIYSFWLPLPTIDRCCARPMNWSTSRRLGTKDPETTSLRVAKGKKLSDYS